MILKSSQQTINMSLGFVTPCIMWFFRRKDNMGNANFFFASYSTLPSMAPWQQVWYTIETLWKTVNKTYCRVNFVTKYSIFWLSHQLTHKPLSDFAWALIQKDFRGPLKVGRSHKLCDVTKMAACGIVATGRSGRVGEIVLMRSPNFVRSTKLLLNWHPGPYSYFELHMWIVPKCTLVDNINGKPWCSTEVDENGVHTGKTIRTRSCVKAEKG